MNYYEHHIGDFLKKTVHLTAVEEGIYRRLLDRYYTTEHALPADVRECCKLARASTKAERDAVRDVLKDFFTLQEDGHHQSRADQEIARFQEKSAKAKRSAEARWGAQRPQSEGNANAYANASDENMRTHCEGNATRARPQTPVTSNQPSSRATGVERRASRLPPDWALPEEWRDWARSERPDLDPLKTAERFRDFWLSKPGKDGTKLDWAATWRNWVRGEKTPQSGRSNGHSGDIFGGS